MVFFLRESERLAKSTISPCCEILMILMLSANVRTLVTGALFSKMRDTFQEFTSGFPTRPGRNDGSFKGHPIKSLIETKLVQAVSAALGSRALKYDIIGSAGKGDWTHTPWLVFLDPAVTTSVANNYYVVYLLSHGCQRLYLMIGQGCTTLKDAVGIPGCRIELMRRAEVLRSRARPQAQRLTNIDIDLNVSPHVWRGKLYESSLVLGVEYEAQALPSNEIMLADLTEALHLYDFLRREGGWSAYDDMVEEAKDERATEGLEQAKRYRQHRSIERNQSHSKKVKQAQGTRCRGCGFEMAEVYGKAAEGMCDAHHLVPLNTLDEGKTVTFDPVKDFAVLCPNCHRTIHRMDDPSDLAGLKALIEAGALEPVIKK